MVQQVSDTLRSPCSFCLSAPATSVHWFTFLHLSSHDPKIVAAAPDNASAFKAGRKEEEPRWYEVCLFTLNRKARLFPADVCLGAVGQNWITYAPLAARDAGKAGDSVVQWP